MADPIKQKLLVEAAALDQRDLLAGIKSQFQLNDHEIYLDGNSLGALPHRVKTVVAETVAREWGERQIRSWNEGWIDLPQQTAAKIAPLVGTEKENLICADSVSINLFKLCAAALLATPARTRILSVNDMFPTDLYIAQGIEQMLGPAQCQLSTCDIEDLDRALDESVNVVILSQVNFRTGAAYDVAALTETIHRHGAQVIWDLSHSAGVLPIDLDRAKVDFAVGCGYKFLNGGPGAPAFVYVRRDLQNELHQPLSGWMGHRAPFEFHNQYQPAAGIDRMLSGTPNILSLKALHAALGVFDQIDLASVYAKAQGLASFFIHALSQFDSLSELQIIKQTSRGAQVSMTHPQAYSIVQALIHDGVIGDFRAPDIARFGFAPLYLSYHDVAEAVFKLEHIMVRKLYSAPQFQEVKAVT